MKSKLIALAMSFLLVVGCQDEKQKLYVYTWADYIDPDLIAKFEDENDCKVIIDTFDSNENMFAKLMAGAKGYDVIMPTEYVMPLLTNANLIEELDISKLPNVVQSFDHKFDSEWSLKWDVPYAFSCIVIIWRKDKCPSELTFQDWNDLFDSRLHGRVYMMDDIREVLGLSLIANGFSANSTNEEELKKAVITARNWKRRCVKIDNEAYRTGIPSEAFYAAMSYNSDAIQLLADNSDNIGYIVPTNGTTSSIDVFCITKSSENKELAYKFIDMFYVLDNAVKNAEYNGIPMPVVGLYDALSDKYKAIPFMRVTDELKSRCEYIKDVGDKIDLYTKAWDKVKAH